MARFHFHNQISFPVEVGRFLESVLQDNLKAEQVDAFARSFEREVRFFRRSLVADVPGLLLVGRDPQYELVSALSIRVVEAMGSRKNRVFVSIAVLKSWG
jgi:hypothetical protein